MAGDFSLFEASELPSLHELRRDPFGPALGRTFRNSLRSSRKRSVPAFIRHSPRWGPHCSVQFRSGSPRSLSPQDFPGVFSVIATRGKRDGRPGTPDDQVPLGAYTWYQQPKGLEGWPSRTRPIAHGRKGRSPSKSQSALRVCRESRRTDKSLA